MWQIGLAVSLLLWAPRAFAQDSEVCAFVDADDDTHDDISYAAGYAAGEAVTDIAWDNEHLCWQAGGSADMYTGACIPPGECLYDDGDDADHWDDSSFAAGVAATTGPTGDTFCGVGTLWNGSACVAASDDAPNCYHSAFCQRTDTLFDTGWGTAQHNPTNATHCNTVEGSADARAWSAGTAVADTPWSSIWIDGPLETTFWFGIAVSAVCVKG